MEETEIDKFEKNQNQLDGLHEEISALSKKSYTDAINLFKLKLVNQVIQGANQILGGTYKPFQDFDSFSEEDLPTNSDVTLVLSQYLNCMESYRVKRINSQIEWTSTGSVAKIYWFWEGTKKETYPPKNIKR
ncbi:MAG: hypothetical protein MI702_14900 [Chlorobiales bacterium]|nr:hypothetical protein [Chlorobiales bacterium]